MKKIHAKKTINIERIIDVEGYSKYQCGCMCSRGSGGGGK